MINKSHYLFLISLLLVSTMLINVVPANGNNNDQFVLNSKNGSIPNTQISPSRVNLGGNPLNVAFVWHQHQPSYLDPTTGYYEQPWVFMHGINDYPYMAKLLEDRPSLRMNMDITGTLLRQLVDYANGTAKDRLIEMALKPNADLTDDEKYFLFGPFPGGNLFDINGQFIVDKFKTVNDNRANYLSWTDNEMNTAKTLFFLKWMNIDFITANTTNAWGPITLSGLNAKATGTNVNTNPFTQSDVDFVIAAGYDIVENVIAQHKGLLQNGQLELVSTPLSHPIGPLLLDTRVELETSVGKQTKMPQNNTMWPDDFRAQIRQSNELFYNLFGQYPNGIWSPEQAVSPDIIQYYQEFNINWSITAPEQLAKVPGKTSSEADMNQLYKVSNRDSSSSMYFVYDDTELSDKVGFNYASFPNQTDASEDFMNVLYRKYQTFKDEDPNTPRLVTVSLDGENAWEWYPDNGNTFRNQLYDAMVQAQNDGWLITTTVSDYIAANPKTTPDHTLTSGSWINGDFTTWIGEDLENRYWDELINARTYVVSKNTTMNATQRVKAWDNIYLAEGSDWFWWAGADQDSGNDEKFDWAFKSLLRAAYYAAGMSETELLARNPFLFEQLKPLSSYERDPSDKSTITVDGVLTDPTEWDNAGWARDPDGGVTEAGTSVNNVIGEYYVTYGEPNTTLEFRIDLSSHITVGADWSDIFLAVYLSGQGDVATNIRTRYGNDTTISTGFPIAYEIGVNLASLVVGVPTNVSIYTASGSETWIQSSGTASVAFADFLEISIPVNSVALGPEKTFLFGIEAAATNTTTFTAVDYAPNDGPLIVNLPPGGVSGDLIFSFLDPVGDETGSAGPVGELGGLEYGTNAAFDPYKGLFDLTSFEVYHDANKEETIFQVGIDKITNPWGSSYGLSHPGILVYIDADRIPGSGGTKGIEASSADVDENSAYEIAFQVGGWENSWAFYSPTLDENGYPTRTGASPGVNMRLVVDSNAGLIRVTIPDSQLGFVVDDTMGYVVATVSNDGFSPNNIRQTAKNAAEYKMGGQSDSSADPNIIDTLVPSAIDQLQLLSNYKETPETFAKLTAVGVGIDGIYDFDAPEIKTASFNGFTADEIKTNRDDGALINASFEFIEESGIGGIWVYSDTGKLLGLSGKEVSFVEFFLKEGVHNITFKVADKIGNVADYSYILTVTDGFAPIVSRVFTDPDPPLPGKFVKVLAEVSDTNIKNVVVEYSLDGGTTYIPTAMSVDNTFDNGWNAIIGKFKEGDVLTLKVTGFDQFGNNATSTPYDVLVTAVTSTSTTTTTTSTTTTTTDTSTSEDSPFIWIGGLIWFAAIVVYRKRK